MFRAFTFLVCLGLFSALALADDVGIHFDKMPIGTTLITEVHRTKPFQRSEKYIGKQGAFYAIETKIRKGNDEFKKSSTDLYDLKGRLVRREREKGFEEYTPYSCHYQLGVCEHDYQYPNPFKNFNQTKHKRRYSTRLEGDTLIVSWALANGDAAEAPFELGPYNLRISNEYLNRLGRKTGFKFIELIEPGKDAASSVSR